jgi:UDP-N-acetylmuramate--alanine ligase
MEEFGTAFENADSLQVLDIYAASEQPIPGITGDVLAQKIAELGHADTRYAPSFSDAIESVTEKAAPGDMILTLGAGSVSQLGPLILESLRSRQPVAGNAS